jgi:hypothetical protein
MTANIDATPPPELVAETAADFAAGRGERWLPNRLPLQPMNLDDVEHYPVPVDDSTTVRLPVGTPADGARFSDTMTGQRRLLALDGDTPRVMLVLSGVDVESAGIWCAAPGGGAPRYVTRWAILPDDIRIPR